MSAPRALSATRRAGSSLWRAIERAGLAGGRGNSRRSRSSRSWSRSRRRSTGPRYGFIRLALLGAAAVFFLTAVARVLGASASFDEAALEAGKTRRGSRGRASDSARAFPRGRAAGDAWTSGSLREAAVEAAASPRAGSRHRHGSNAGGAAAGGWAPTGIALLVLGLAGLAGGTRTPLVLGRIANPKIRAARLRSGSGWSPARARWRAESRSRFAPTSPGSTRRPELDEPRAGGVARPSRSGAREGAEGARAGRARLRARPAQPHRGCRLSGPRRGPETPTYALNVRDLPRATGYRVRLPVSRLHGAQARGEPGHHRRSRGAARHAGDLSRSRLNRAVAQATATLRAGRLRRCRASAASGASGSRSRFGPTTASRSGSKIPADGRPTWDPSIFAAIPDRPPTVTVLAPAPVEDVTRDMTAVILAGATDDHGVRKILLRYRVRQEPERDRDAPRGAVGTRELADPVHVGARRLLASARRGGRVSGRRRGRQRDRRAADHLVRHAAASLPVGDRDPRLDGRRAGRVDRDPGGRRSGAPGAASRSRRALAGAGPLARDDVGAAAGSPEDLGGPGAVCASRSTRWRRSSRRTPRSSPSRAR